MAGSVEDWRDDGPAKDWMDAVCPDCPIGDCADDVGGDWTKERTVEDCAEDGLFANSIAVGSGVVDGACLDFWNKDVM